jgi:hypothetical protein
VDFVPFGVGVEALGEFAAGLDAPGIGVGVGLGDAFAAKPVRLISKTAKTAIILTRWTFN